VSIFGEQKKKKIFKNQKNSQTFLKHIMVSYTLGESAFFHSVRAFFSVFFQKNEKNVMKNGKKSCLHKVPT